MIESGPSTLLPIISLAAALTLPISTVVAGEIREGEPYPDFVLPEISDRRPIALSDFRGKKVLLIQFASW